MKRAARWFGFGMLAMLAGCGGGGGSGGGVTAPPPPPPPPVATFKTWCERATGTTYHVTDGVLAEIVGSNYDAGGDELGGGYEVCRQQGEIGRPGTSRVVRFEVTIPGAFAGRLVFLGGGGFDGAVGSQSWSPNVLEHGFATVATDMGHVGADAFDASWALDDPGAVEDYAFAAIPDVREAAASVVCSWFGSNGGDGTTSCALEQVYFEGCSGGGRQALLAAQRRPDLFDGVIARAPSLAVPGLMSAANRIAQRVATRTLSPAKLATVDAAQLEACDALDGLSDGVIGRAFDCPFDPAQLLCTEGDADDCLTEAELETLATVRSPTPIAFAQRDGASEYPAWPVAPIADVFAWPIWLLSGAPPTYPEPLLFAIQQGFFRYFVAEDPALDTLGIDPADYSDALGALSTQLDATSPDLSAFAAAGGKLILWHGAADAAVSPLATIHYYQALQEAAAADPSLPAVADFARLYVAPGVMHCERGPGADQVDLVSVLDAWVAGTAPGDIVAWNWSETGARPLCEWPAYPHYDGLGNSTLPSSFACEDP